jgi:hypothetical protein
MGRAITPRRCRLALALAAALLTPALAASDLTLVRVPAATLDALPDRARIVDRHGDLVFVELPAVDAVGVPGAVVIEGGYRLSLPGMPAMDPLQRDPGASLAGADPERPAIGLVQFRGPPKAEWLDALESHGITVAQHIHPFTYVVWASPTALTAARAEVEGVRWAGLHPLEARVQAPGARAGTTQPFRLLALRAAAVDPAALAATGARVDGRRATDRHFEEFLVEASAEALEALAAVPGVLSVQDLPTDGGTRGELSNQQFAGNVDASNQPLANYPNWLAQFGLTGAGVLMANVDSGLDENHPDLRGRVQPCTGHPSCGGTSSSHGSHTAAIMAGDGASNVRDSRGFLRGLGVAFGANLIEQRYSPTFTEAGGMLTLMRVSAANGAVLSGNSWGPSGSPRGYDANTRQVDVGVRDTNPDEAGDQPLLYVLSIMNGNGGTSTQGTPDEAKNTLTVGSTNSQAATTGAPMATWQSLSPNSGHGPALDGRLIPHLVAPGCRVDSASTSNGYALLCGTSMASPHVAGASALLIEALRSREARTPSPALAKAHFVAGTVDLFGGTDANGNPLARRPNPRQGWGALRLGVALNAIDRSWRHDQAHVFTATGQAWTVDLEPRDPAQPVRVVLTWTDAPGHGTCASASCTTPAWNNDLDLEVQRGATLWRGNVFGSDGWSTTGGTPDLRNNLEGVMLPAGSPGGGFTVRVRATNINSDALPNSPGALQQDFALVCVNCRLAAPDPGLIFRDSFGD